VGSRIWNERTFHVLIGNSSHKSVVGCTVSAAYSSGFSNGWKQHDNIESLRKLLTPRRLRRCAGTRATWIALLCDSLTFLQPTLFDSEWPCPAQLIYNNRMETIRLSNLVRKVKHQASLEVRPSFMSFRLLAESQSRVASHRGRRRSRYQIHGNWRNESSHSAAHVQLHQVTVRSSVHSIKSFKCDEDTATFFLQRDTGELVPATAGKCVRCSDFRGISVRQSCCGMPPCQYPLEKTDQFALLLNLT
jgi:hypothetical protein